MSALTRNLLREPHPYPGRLITVEGIDGSGTSTQLLLLDRWLTARGHAADRPLVEHLFRLAKQRETVFEDSELEALVREFNEKRAAARG